MDDDVVRGGVGGARSLVSARWRAHSHALSNRGSLTIRDGPATADESGSASVLAYGLLRECRALRRPRAPVRKFLAKSRNPEMIARSRFRPIGSCSTIAT